MRPRANHKWDREGERCIVCGESEYIGTECKATSVSEPDNSDAELGAYVRRMAKELSDSPKSFLYQVQRAISDQDAALSATTNKEPK